MSPIFVFAGSYVTVARPRSSETSTFSTPATPESMRVTLFTQPWQSMPSTFNSTVSIPPIIQFQHMPHRLTRFLLALAIALAVPVQGFAAVSAGLCMALGHHGDQGHSHGANAGGHS